MTKTLIFWKFAYKKKFGFFGKNRASSLFYIYNRLTCCKKSEKSNDGKYENFCHRRREERGETEAILKDQKCWSNKSKFGDALLPLSSDQISKLKFIHGNRLHLGEWVLEILHLHAETVQWRLAYPKITRFENSIILLKIDLKWLKNQWRWFLLTIVSIEKL